MSTFVRPSRVADPALRFIGFHHAGGSATAYHPLTRNLPPDWDLLLLELPGRGRRRTEPLITDMASLVRHVLDEVSPHTDVPCVLFGHSMGAIVAVEVGRELAVRRRPPLWVGVSGRPAPLIQGLGTRRLSELSDAELFATLVGLGGTPPQLAEEPDLKNYFLRIVRADLRAVDSYLPASDRAPLPCPLTAFGGITDPSAPPASLAAWEYETVAQFRQCLFPGGHFYFLDTAFAALGREIRTEVRAALRSAARCGGWSMNGADAGTTAAGLARLD